MTSQKEINYSGLAVLSIFLAPISLIQLQKLEAPFWVSFSSLLFFTCLGFFFQALRQKETRRLRALEKNQSPSHYFATGDQVSYRSKTMVVLKTSFAHYYLRDPDIDQIYLVHKRKVHLENRGA